MKKYVLPSLISLALSSGYVLAQTESAAAAPEWTPPTAEQAAEQTPAPTAELIPPPPPPAPPLPIAPQPPSGATSPSDAAKSFHEMREKRDSLWQEMQTLRRNMNQAKSDEERQQLREQLQQNRQSMRELLQQGGMHGGPFGMGRTPGWGGPQGPGHGYYGKRPMPPIGPGARGFAQKMPPMPGGHPAKMEQRLENIENLLKEIVELLKNKSD